MMKGRLLALSAVCAAISACNSGGGPGSVTTKEQKVAEAKAIRNQDCAFEDLKFCAHMIEKRTVLRQFFDPDSSTISNEEKKRGQRLLTEEVVDAASTIQQCRKVSEPALPLIPSMLIDQKPYNLMATSPVSENSTCFISPVDG